MGSRTATPTELYALCAQHATYHHAGCSRASTRARFSGSDSAASKIGLKNFGDVYTFIARNGEVSYVGRYDNKPPKEARPCYDSQGPFRVWNRAEIFNFRLERRPQCACFSVMALLGGLGGGAKGQCASSVRRWAAALLASLLACGQFLSNPRGC